MKATLVKIDVVSADLGKTAKEIVELVDGGTLLEPGLVWVFDLSQRVNTGRRDLRFWRFEIHARAEGKQDALRGLELDAVVERILPANRDRLQAGELDLLWQLRPCRRFNLNRHFTQPKRCAQRVYVRAELIAFLKRRWLGATFTRPHWKSSPVVPSPARVAPRCKRRPPQFLPGDVMRILRGEDNLPENRNQENQQPTKQQQEKETNL